MEILLKFLDTTGFSQMEGGNAVMIVIGMVFIALAIIKDYEPLLLLPIGFGVIVGNIPYLDSMSLGVYDDGIHKVTGEFEPMNMSVLSMIYTGVKFGLFPPLIFLGIGAMTDFSTMLSNPRLVLLGAAAQIGVFLTLLGALYLGFTAQQAGAIGIIGGADGPTAIFLSARLAPEYLGAIAIAAYSYMALVPVIQPPIMKLLTTREERLIRMKPPRKVSKRERIIFPIAAFLICTLIAPGALVLLGMLFFGNLMKESGVTDRLAQSARTAMIDIVTILLGFAVGASTQAEYFLRKESLMIFALGAASFAVATAGGVLFAKIMNLFLEEKINPLVGAAGVSAVPDSARVVQMVGQQEDPHNFLLMHAMAPNVAGVIGSAVAAGVLWSVLVQ
ncbi:MAG: sodium ion-translocating decarboxylase subunit beta [Planctomycetales bacterium]|nr:sodium ion-translocating decarboxylase subunit beta [Planctomycetales bacterium]NIM08456.1 sodium ion-translocating decarboxylase subunit beta [Planctomycetales bacterium]NIN77061.1 sodium ion-translocating decarboxylase subunit beta [Planctomycetales bacterium]NIO34246.1 sodium ion-translocating decarboxylase subunit beta [Planctomycetales bacterium]NIO46047.1 sodium ion-translocating decarboxylase subunit beta [Planctomycetales bacterium]